MTDSQPRSSALRLHPTDAPLSVEQAEALYHHISAEAHQAATTSARRRVSSPLLRGRQLDSWFRPLIAVGALAAVVLVTVVAVGSWGSTPQPSDGQSTRPLSTGTNPAPGSPPLLSKAGGGPFYGLAPRTHWAPPTPLV